MCRQAMWRPPRSRSVERSIDRMYIYMDVGHENAPDPAAAAAVDCQAGMRGGREQAGCAHGGGGERGAQEDGGGGGGPHRPRYIYICMYLWFGMNV